MSKQGNFTKKVLVDWISSECDRQLVNNLGFNNLDWLVNPEILPLKRQRYAVELKLGKDYETLVYDALIRSTALNTKYRSDELNNITKSYATKELLTDIFHNLQEDSVAYLLEHSFPITPSFINEVIFQTSKPPIF